MARMSVPDLYALVRRHGFGAITAPMAVAVIMAESGGDPQATHTNSNGSVDRGLWQINSVHIQSGQISESQCFDPDASSDFAYRLSHGGQDFSAWSTAQPGGKAYQLLPGVAKQLGAKPVSGFEKGALDVASDPTKLLTDPVQAAVGAVLSPIFSSVGSFLVNAGLVVGGIVLVLGGVALAVVMAKENVPQPIQRAGQAVKMQGLIRKAAMVAA